MDLEVRHSAPVVADQIADRVRAHKVEGLKQAVLPSLQTDQLELEVVDPNNEGGQTKPLP